MFFLLKRYNSLGRSYAIWLAKNSSNDGHHNTVMSSKQAAAAAAAAGVSLSLQNRTATVWQPHEWDWSSSLLSGLLDEQAALVGNNGGGDGGSSGGGGGGGGVGGTSLDAAAALMLPERTMSLDEFLYSAMASSLWVDALYLFFYSVLALFGLALNVASLAVLARKPFRAAPAVCYYRVISANYLMQTFVAVFFGVCFTNRFVGGNATYRHACALLICYGLIPVASLNFFYGTVLDIALLLERIATLSPALRVLYRLRPAHNCLVYLVVCAAVNFQYNFVYEPVVVCYEQRSATGGEEGADNRSLSLPVNCDAYYLIGISRFAQSSSGHVMAFVMYGVRDVATFVAVVLLNIIAAVYFKRYVRRHANLLGAGAGANVRPSRLAAASVGTTSLWQRFSRAINRQRQQPQHHDAASTVNAEHATAADAAAVAAACSGGGGTRANRCNRRSQEQRRWTRQSATRADRRATRMAFVLSSFTIVSKSMLVVATVNIYVCKYDSIATFLSFLADFVALLQASASFVVFYCCNSVFEREVDLVRAAFAARLRTAWWQRRAELVHVLRRLCCCCCCGCQQKTPPLPPTQEKK